MGRVQRVKAPNIVRSYRATRIQHREQIGSVLGSVAFNAIKFACNPGIAATFPWLAAQAIQWEQYRFNKLNFEYITRTATTTVGSVLLAPDYDASDSPPTTEIQASTYQDSVENVPWKDICAVLQPSSMHALGPKKFVRSGLVAGADIKTYDVANLYLCTVEETGNAAIGKLWVDYDVEFFIPQQSTSALVPSPTQTSFYTNHASTALPKNSNTAVPWDTKAFDPLGFGSPTAGVFTPAAGAYLLIASICVSDPNVATNDTTDTAVLEIAKNGAALPTGSVNCSVINYAGTSAIQWNMVVQGLVSCNGTDTISFDLFVNTAGTGAAISLIGDSCQLSVSLA